MAAKAKEDPARGVGEILATGLVTNLRTIVVAFAVCFCVYCVSESFKAFAGRLSYADLNVVLTTFADVKFKIGIEFTVTASGWVYGLLQRRLRRNTVERLAGRNAELEQRWDKHRSSSQITTKGTTRRDDLNP